ncbi:MAG: hypothetical protein A2945_04275 [Candidatus Liptonbacteria bacterium RIFCSPLOWO2_01_FULL_52_25]|uniref:Uncharacterized protein n=1 Tax=Candidatus Liptonbacteria bacterium RIFCSPLOWO2_01_FULL_52_25 TaxID=1798650 RepID=A0A1G2CHZ4_9BACT|nr:MAG: hypothetical protein A2945_04275 [Candidatus Liptonbacteria bacterium RIFCSPLOWO2_01_FULL_52_25]
MAEEQIQTLEATQGKNPGEAIASYGRSIVFLPAGVKPGQTVRARLQEIKPDSRGRMMYRAIPAPVEYSERWKDNGDGAASRVTIATDWLGKTSEEGAVETRPLATRERELRTDSRFTVRFGADLRSTFVEERKVRIIGEECEEVNLAGALAWRITNQREEPVVGIDEHVAIEYSTGPSEWNLKNLEPVYDNGWVIEIQIHTEDDRWRQFKQPWGTLPQWLRAEEEAKRPLCACGRRRRESQSDGYTKCELCRAEERCARCGTQTKVAMVNGHLVCAKCQPYAEQEGLIARTLNADHLAAIAAEARKLRAGNTLAQAEGEAVLRATADHIALDWGRNDFIWKWAGYGWYYFCDDGVYGSKLAPAALTVLELLPQASGNGLVDMAAWFGAGPKSSSSDFYLRTQVNGETGLVPALTEGQLKQVAEKIEARTPVLADRLRGSEKDRMEAVAGFRRIAEAFGADSREARAVADILQGNEQDYAAASRKVQEWQLCFAAAARGEALINFGGHFRVMGRTDNAQFWVVQPDGSLREPDEVQYRKRYSSEGDKRWRLVRPEELALSWSKNSSASPHEFTVVKLPVNGITPEQKAAVVKLEREIAEEWMGATGMASGVASPSIGNGWGLVLKLPPVAAPTPGSAKSVAELPEKVTPEMLDALRRKFGK